MSSGQPFQTKYGSFQFRVLPFGLCNAPATFQRTMDTLMRKHRAYADVYLDGIIMRELFHNKRWRKMRGFNIEKTTKLYRAGESRAQSRPCAEETFLFGGTFRKQLCYASSASLVEVFNVQIFSGAEERGYRGYKLVIWVLHRRLQKPWIMVGGRGE